MTIHERILKPKTNNQGYLYVSLCYNEIIKDYLVHRLIAITFLPNPENKETVNHIDGNPKNNKLENLEWATQSKNNHHSFDVLKRKASNSKKVAMLNDNKEIIQIFNSQTEASKYLLNSSKGKGHIGYACKNNIKRYGYYWKYI